VFVDDSSVLLPGWLKAHTHAATHEYVLCGLMCKRAHLEVSDEGTVLRADEIQGGADPRLELFSDYDVSRCEGGLLYGGTFSVPLEYALRVNGQDEIYDAIGAEDCDFGMRLERAGAPIIANRTCRILEDAGNSSAPIESLPRFDEFAELCRQLFDRLRREQDRVAAIGNLFDLRTLRDDVLAGGGFPAPVGPKTYWPDGRSLTEI
jgi:hypothetical protein